MKHKLIALILLFVTVECGLAFDTLDRVANCNCPETNETDIFLIGHMVTERIKELQLGNVELRNYSYDEDLSEETNDYFETIKKLKKYWKERGVWQIIDLEICEKIFRTIKQVQKIKNPTKFRKIFFRAGNYYFIYYKSKKVVIDGGLPHFIQVLDETFNLVATEKF